MGYSSDQLGRTSPSDSLAVQRQLSSFHELESSVCSQIGLIVCTDMCVLCAVCVNFNRCMTVFYVFLFFF